MNPESNESNYWLTNSIFQAPDSSDSRDFRPIHKIHEYILNTKNQILPKRQHLIIVPDFLLIDQSELLFMPYVISRR